MIALIRKIDGRPWRREPEAELPSVEYGQAFVAEGHMIIVQGRELNSQSSD